MILYLWQWFRPALRRLYLDTLKYTCIFNLMICQRFLRCGQLVRANGQVTDWYLGDSSHTDVTSAGVSCPHLKVYPSHFKFLENKKIYKLRIDLLMERYGQHFNDISIFMWEFNASTLSRSGLTYSAGCAMRTGAAEIAKKIVFDLHQGQLNLLPGFNVHELEPPLTLLATLLSELVTTVTTLPQCSTLHYFPIRTRQ